MRRNQYSRFSPNPADRKLPETNHILSITTISSTMVLLLPHDDNQRRLHLVLLMVLLIQYHNSVRDRHYLRRSAIVHPQETPWRKLYKDADESSFLHMTGLNRLAFSVLLDYIFDLGAIVRHRRRGRPRSLGPDGYLGLLLFYLGSTMTIKHLCLIFGITPSVCGRAINSMLKRGFIGCVFRLICLYMTTRPPKGFTCNSRSRTRG